MKVVIIAAQEIVKLQTAKFPPPKHSDSCAHLDEAIHVCLHIGYGHPLHDDVHDAALQGLPLLPGRLGEAAGPGRHSRGAQAGRLTLQLLPVAGKRGGERGAALE